MRLRGFQQWLQGFAQANAIFGHEVGRRHSEKFVPGVPQEYAGAVVHVQDAPVSRLEDNDRVRLRVQGVLELRQDRLNALLIFDVRERSDPGEDLAGRTSLRNS